MPSLPSSSTMPNCGCSGWAGATAVQLSASSVWSSAGSTSAPFGRPSTASISSKAAGSAPITPATMTGALGGCAFSRATSACSSRLRCSTGDSKPLLGKMRRPELRNDLQEFQRARPMLGKILRHQLVQALRADALRLQRIHQPRQLLGEPRGLRRRSGTRCRIVADLTRVARPRTLSRRPPLHQLGQHQVAIQHADHARRASRGAGREVLDAGDDVEVFRTLRQRLQLRQQHGRAVRCTQERLLQRPRRPPRRQQQRNFGHLQGSEGLAARRRQVSHQQSTRNRRQERRAGRNRVDAWGHRHPLSARIRPRRPSGSLRPAPGLPACRHASICRPCAGRKRDRPRLPGSTQHSAKKPPPAPRRTGADARSTHP